MGSSCCADCAHKETEKKADPETVATPCADEAAPTSVSNQELLRIARGAQASVAVGAPDDPAEKEAEETARLVMTGQPIRRSPATSASSGGAATSGGVRTALGSPGRALDGGARRRMEHGFAADFSGVRVHDGTDAAKSARGIGADAYTLGSDIVFAPGRYDPGSAAGQRLLAHELTHIVQQRAQPGPIRRQVPPVTPPPVTPPPVSQLETDVCLVNVDILTNEELVQQSARVKTYLDARKRGQDDYYAYANLGRRLDTERRRRIMLGHLYLARDSTVLPTEIYRMSQNGSNIFVYRADAAPLRGMPAQVDGYLMTAMQFYKALDDLHIPHIDLGAYFANQQDRNAPLQLIAPPRPEPRFPTWPTFGSPTDVFGVPRLPGMSPFGFTGRPTDLINLGGFPAAQPWTVPADPRLIQDPTTSALLAGRGYQSLFTLNAGNALAQPMNFDAANARSRAGALTNYRGDLAELAQGRGSVPAIITQGTLNTPAVPNFEVYDWRNRFTGRTTSVTSTVPTPGVPTGPRLLGPIDTQANWSQYEVKLARALGMEEQAKLGVATGRLNAEYGTSLTPLDVTSRSYLAINADHVEQFRARLRANIPQAPGDYALAIDAVLHARPMEVSTTSGATVRVSSWNDLQTASTSMTPAEYQSSVASAADLVAARVISNGITTAELARLVSFREYARSIGIVTPEQYRAQIPPELVESIRLGSATRASMEAGVRGGAIQGGVGTAMDAYRMATDPYAHPYAVPELAARGVLQFGGGALGSSAETAIVSSVNESFLGQTTATASVARGGSRLVGGVGPAMIIAPAVTTGTMALDELFTDAYYTRIDYSSAAARSSVAGGGGALAGAAATGAYFAVFGSEAPIVGNAIGFVVGFLGYLVVDAIVGDDIERSVREGMGEGGCPRPPRPAPVNFEDVPMRGCFAAGTPIRMADGAERPIEALRRGDKVMAVDVTGRELRPEVVERTLAHPDTAVLTLVFDGGLVLRTTSEHPLFDGIAWVTAGRLHIGDTVLCCLDGTALGTLRIAAMALKPAEPVYDLTISGTHTFVAAGIVAHNKIF